jgi:hypothetical protein
MDTNWMKGVSVSIEAELRDMAKRLVGDSWRTKFSQEWTQEEKAAADRAFADPNDTNPVDWIGTMMDVPIRDEVIDEWTQGGFVHRVTRSTRADTGALLSEREDLSRINHESGPTRMVMPNMEDFLQRCPEFASPSDRERLGLSLPPERQTAEILPMSAQ